MVSWIWILVAVVVLIGLYVWYEVRRRARHRRRLEQAKARVAPVAAVTPSPPVEAPVVEPAPSPPPVPTPPRPTTTPLPFLQKGTPEPELEVVPAAEDTPQARVSRLAEEQWDTMEVVGPSAKAPTRMAERKAEPELYVARADRPHPASHPTKKHHEVVVAKKESPRATPRAAPESEFVVAPKEHKKFEPLGDGWGNVEYRKDQKRQEP